MRSLVSVVIPCYNQGQWLSRAVESALRSTYSPIEVIVIDDGSTDEETHTAINQLSVYSMVRVVRQKNMGVCYARNRAIQLASGEYVLTLDGDDELSVNYIKQAMAVFDRYLDVCQVGGNFAYLTDTGMGPMVQGYKEGYVSDLIMANNYIPNTYLFKKDAWREIGGFSIDLNRLALEDVDFTMRLHARGFKTYLLSDCSCLYRQHGESRNNNQKRRLLAKMLIFLHVLGWFLRHPKYILPFMMWKRFSWMVNNVDGTTR